MTHFLPSFSRSKLWGLSLLLLLLGTSLLVQAQSNATTAIRTGRTGGTTTNPAPATTRAQTGQPGVPQMILPRPDHQPQPAPTRSARLMAPTASTIRYVKAGGTGNGSSWSNASGDLQAMINASASGDQVWMAGGTYIPSTAGRSNPRDASFTLKEGLQVLGGFTGNAGSEGNASARTAMPSTTTLSGDIGTVGDNSDNSYHVVFNVQNGLTNATVLDGVVITRGNANGPNQVPQFGAGMFNIVSSPIVRNCIFSANYAAQAGALVNFGCTGPKVINCVFTANTGESAGGIYDQDNTGSQIINCFFSQNSGGTAGGYLTTNSPDPALINCTFRDNSSAIGNYGTGVLSVTNSLLWNNGGANSIRPGSGTVRVNYSLLEPGATTYTDGGNNKTATFSPFENATGPALKACAPAIDAGSDAANATTTDLLGNARKVRTIDMGAAEFGGTPYTLSVTAQATPTVVCVGNSTSLQATPGGSPNTPYSYTWVASGGATLSSTSSNPVSATLTSAGTPSFSVTVTDALGCLATASVSVTANALPTQYTVTGGGSYCTGANGVVVGLSGSQTGVNYQLRRDGNAVGSAVAGTGSALSFGNQTTAGNYTVQATNASTTCQQTMTGSASVTVNNLPTPGLTNNGPLSCTMTTVTLTATGGSSYTFTDGNGQVLTGTGDTRSVNSPGTYAVRVANQTGCTSTTTTIVTSNTVVVTAMLSASPSTTLTCSQPTLTLTASGGDTYRFSPNVASQNGNQATVAQAGVYSVTATSTATGCFSTTSITISQDNVAPSASLANNGPLSCTMTSATLTANPNGQSYRFSAGATPIGTTNQATVTTAGIYSVTVSSGNGCSSVASTTVTGDQTPPTVSITPTSGTLTCANPTLTLTANTTASSLIWSTGQTTSSISVSVAGTYSVTVTSANGCRAMSQATVSGTTTAPEAPTLSANPATTTTNQPIIITASGCAGGMINWALLGGTGQAGPTSFTLTQPGNYSLSASCTLNGCTSAYSPLLTLQIRPGGFAITGVNMVNCQLTNPARGEYQVQFTPQYTGQNSNPIRFAVVNELAATTAPAPYTLRLYTDNPVITLVATQSGNSEARFAYNWLASCQSGTSPNQPPTTTGIPSQTIVQGQGYQLQLTTYFSDPDGQALSFQASGLPAGLSLTGSVISGTPSQTGVSNVNVTAIDPGGLQVSTSFTLTVTPMPVTPPSGFAIVGVSTVSCQVLSAGDRRVTFTPQYAGVSGAPISFSVVNELVATTSPGPYSLNLYTDNPTITLSAQQGATVSTYRYNWLAVCTPAARVGNDEAGSRLTVRVLGNPVVGNTAEVEISGVTGQPVQLNVVDLQGKPVHAQRIEQAQAIERMSLPLGASNGVLLLQVNTPTQRQQIKLLRTN